MTKKKERRGRKALPPELKKPPQPTIKINSALHPFVKLLKRQYKAGYVSDETLAALTQLLVADMPIETVIEEQIASTSADEVKKSPKKPKRNSGG